MLEQWEQIKARERTHAGERPSLLAGVPKALPSLLRSHEIGTRVASVGFEWSEPRQVVDKIEEEVRELREALEKLETGDRRHAAEEMGDLLFSIANLARKLDIEPESALREANEKFTRRFQEVEADFAARGRAMADASLDEMESVWQTVKRRKTQKERRKTQTRPGRRESRSARPSAARPRRPRAKRSSR